MKNVQITNNNLAMNRMILRSLLLGLAGLALLYVLILGNLIFDIVERRSLEKEILTLSTEVGQLELAYLSTAGDLDLSTSVTLGFKEIESTFATRKSLGSLSFAGNEI